MIMLPQALPTSMRRHPVPSLGIALIVIVLALEIPFVVVDILNTHGWALNLRHGPDTGKHESKEGKFMFAPVLDELVGMRVDYTSHYQYDTAEGAAEFAALLPHTGHLVYLDDHSPPEPRHPKAYTVTLFHQMKCLDIIREQYASPSDMRLPLANHCLNYLRQTVLCRPNIGVEPAKNSEGTAVRGYDAVCRDWTKVYEEAERNVAAYWTWRNGTIRHAA